MKKLFYVLIILSALAASITAQPPADEKPRLKTFGWSLTQPLGKEAEPIQKAEAPKSQTTDSDEEVIKVETNLVVNDILVTDAKGQAITGLKKEDFIVTENGRPQAIETFALGSDAAVPRSIVLIMDYSISQIPYIETSIEAAKVMIDKLNPRDRVAIVTDDVDLITGFTRDKILLKQKLDLLKAKALSGTLGKSEQYSALYAVLNEVFDAEDVRPIVFFQTDGDEDYALKDSKILSDGELPERLFSYGDVLTAAERARATIYTIIPGTLYEGLSDSQQLEKAKEEEKTRKVIYERINSPSFPKTDQKKPDSLLLSSAKASLRRQLLLTDLAKSTGGWASLLESADQAQEIYSKILAGIDQRYVIGYYPSNENRDGNRRTVKIEVRNHPEYIISGGKSYYAPKN